jgi:hypothetical protein
MAHLTSRGGLAVAVEVVPEKGPFIGGRLVGSLPDNGFPAVLPGPAPSAA